LPGTPGARDAPWPLRAADVDVARHVNNAVSLAALEDVARAEGIASVRAPWNVEVEYRLPIDPGEHPRLVWARDPGGVVVGALYCDGTARTTFRLAVPGDARARS